MQTYDYIIVGAGSAGAAVAGRLSEDPDASVLLVEAGGSHRNMKVQVPAAFAQQFKTDLDWHFETEPEPHLDGRRVYLPRGKMLGGSSGMNAQIYIRGNASDYDTWAKRGATGWSYDEVLPLFRRAETNSRGASEYHGAAGPLHHEDPRSPNPLSLVILEAMVAAGIERNDDFNGERQEGAGLYQVTQKRGTRWTTADAYVEPARERPNVTVLTGAHAHKVLIEDGRAVGVQLDVGKRVRTVRAEREVVLSAGAYNSPHLLMLSGIGPADQLTEHGIDVVVDNPHVGAHLMDHPMYLLNTRTAASGTLAEAESPKQLLKYLLLRRGLLTSNVGEVGAFIHTDGGDGGEAPDMQFIAGPVYFWDHGQVEHDDAAYAIGCSLVGAQSEGHLRLRSADPHDKVAITHNYFAERRDMDAMVAGIERAREITATEPLASVTGTEIHPGPDVTSRADIEAEIRRNVEHTYHPSCTARMGRPDDAVVDPELRVYGVSGLRVADASVFPTITHGNTHAPAVLVGEKAADMIRATKAVA